MTNIKTTTLTITLPSDVLGAFNEETQQAMGREFEHRLIHLLESHQLALKGLREGKEAMDILVDLDVYEANKQAPFLR